MDLHKIDLRTKARCADEAATTELSEAQLSSVSGGNGNTKAAPSLMKACATGVHLREATITIR